MDERKYRILINNFIIPVDISIFRVSFQNSWLFQKHYRSVLNKFNLLNIFTRVLIFWEEVDINEILIYDIEERKKKRLQQNRVSALKCRKKKKELFEHILIERDELKAQNKLIKEQLDHFTKLMEEKEQEKLQLLTKIDKLEKNHYSPNNNLLNSSSEEVNTGNMRAPSEMRKDPRMNENVFKTSQQPTLMSGPPAYSSTQFLPGMSILKYLYDITISREISPNSLKNF